MKTQPLERLLVYTDKKSINDFNIPEMMFDQLYELYVTTKDDILDDHHTSADFFNEVFYFLTCIYANNDSAERLNTYLYGESGLMPSPPDIENPQTKQELKAAREYEERNMEINEYVLLFVWVILKKQKELPKHVRFFLTALEHALEGASIYDTFKEYIQNHTSKYSISFEMKPQLTLEMKLRTAEEWKQATDDFDREVVRHIVRRFYDVGDRANVVEIIRNALNESNKNPKSHPKASMVTHRKKADDAFLDTLLKESEEEEAQRVEEVKVIEQSKDARIAELEEKVKSLEKEKRVLAQDRDHWKNECEHLVRFIDSRNRKNREKQVPSVFRTLPGKEIINQLVVNEVIKINYRQIASDAYDELYEWNGSKKLFGYFVEKVSFELDLRKSGKSGNIIWEPFMQAFKDAEDLRHEAASAISAMKKKGALMPEGAEKIDEAIKYANAMTVQYKP